jgi:hypothetical protein
MAKCFARVVALVLWLGILQELLTQSLNSFYQALRGGLKRSIF